MAKNHISVLKRLSLKKKVLLPFVLKTFFKGVYRDPERISKEVLHW